MSTLNIYICSNILWLIGDKRALCVGDLCFSELDCLVVTVLSVVCVHGGFLSYILDSEKSMAFLDLPMLSPTTQPGGRKKVILPSQLNELC